MMLEEIKRTLEVDDAKVDAQLEDFMNRISDRLLLRLGVDVVPTELTFIVVECAVKRFNLKGNEGMSSYTQEGESIKYNDLLDEYSDDITLWISKRDRGENAKLGKVRFI